MADVTLADPTGGATAADARLGAGVTVGELITGSRAGGPLSDTGVTPTGACPAFSSGVTVLVAEGSWRPSPAQSLQLPATRR